MPAQPTAAPQQADMGAPLTRAVRQAIGDFRHGPLLDDLLFLERWELSPVPGTPAALRISQIRRANPALAAAVREELQARR